MRINFMRTNLAVALVLVLAGAVSTAPAAEAGTQDPSVLPMYGGLDRQSDPVLKGADDALIEGTTKAFGSRAAASKRFTDEGFRFYFHDDLSTAMRRFNQGWLLDPNNPDVFYGFMAVSNDLEKYCDARRFGEQAFALGLEKSAETLADAGRATALCAMHDPSVDDATKSEYIKKSSQYFSEALALKPDSPYVYGMWASVSYAMGDYQTAWHYVDLARKNGGKVPDRFLKMLKEKMPEPKG
jgi:tetratricopeptide (TPR) repeat protein